MRLYYYNEYPTLKGFNVWIRNEKLIEENIENVCQIQGLKNKNLKYTEKRKINLATVVIVNIEQ